ncbi:MAG: hypothetical protein HYZ42_06815 [Bacteroidetes bacterium]|nr:hypothetical protein [Bacteroidota bacterium]
MKQSIFIIIGIAMCSLQLQAQLPEKATHKREISCRTSVFNGFSPRSYIYYTQYTKDTKWAWQHGLSITRSLSLYKVDYNNGGSVETNISSIPLNYQYQHVYNRFFNYHISKLRNKSINNRIWYSHGPGVSLLYNSASGKEQYSSITVQSGNNLFYDRITKLKTVNQMVGLGVMYSALLKYAISERFNAGITFEYGAYLNLNRLNTTTSAIQWDQERFNNASKDVKNLDNISSNLSSSPSFSLSLSYMF